MKISIVTINYNNVEGLKRTLASVAEQSYRDIEHIIIDGGSSDGSVEAIKEYVAANPSRDPFFKHIIKWVSEKDNGIYNAMNKGIKIALGKRVVDAFNRSERSDDKFSEADRPKQSGVENKELPDYIQILNSGDIFVAPNVTERMVAAVEKAEYPELLYGNMIKKDFSTGKILGKSGEVEYGLLNYFTGTLNHDCCYFRRNLFEKYGVYDEKLKIVSDWKWFVQAIGLGNVKPVYADIDVTIFDASGISESNLDLRNKERRQVLEEVLPPAVLADYEAYSFHISQYQRLKKHHLWGLVWFMERVLFKLNKWGLLK